MLLNPGLGLTYYEFDRVGRTTFVGQNLGGKVYYAYDASGQKVWLRDASLAPLPVDPLPV